MKVIKLATFIFLGFLCSGYSQETGTVTDIDGNVYKTVKIGDQWWMSENLIVTHYRNGDAIPHITNNSEWTRLQTSAYCSYDNDEANVTIYGRLYNWYAVNDSHGIAPAGWHVPSDDEWQTLVDYLGGSSDAGSKMKEIGIDHWLSPNEGATNESDFSALPGGFRGALEGTYHNLGGYTVFWSATEYGNLAWTRELWDNISYIVRDYVAKQNGFSVRCLKDEGSGGIESKSETFKSFELNQNYPNPFNSETIISYNLPFNCYVRLTIYNIKGEEIAALFDGHESAGFHSVTWTADDVSNGLYFYQLQAENIQFVKKLVIQK
jgi:uncharacterized protein (TIGR02145 family)